jgi:hypothetical protein
MIYVLMKSIVLGIARTRELVAGRELMTTAIGALYVVMFAVYTWVDISWDPRLTPVLGLAIAVCSQPIGATRPDESGSTAGGSHLASRRPHPTVPARSPERSDDERISRR